MKKIAIPVVSDTENTDIDPRFGRALWFCLVHPQTGEKEFIDNKQSLNTTSGAGIQAAQTIIKAGATVLLTGHCGPKAFRALLAAGVEIYTGASGTLNEVINAYKNDRLKKAAQADVQGHWAG